MAYLLASNVQFEVMCGVKDGMQRTASYDALSFSCQVVFCVRRLTIVISIIVASITSRWCVAPLMPIAG